MSPAKPAVARPRTHVIPSEQHDPQQASDLLALITLALLFGNIVILMAVLQ